MWTMLLLEENPHATPVQLNQSRLLINLPGICYEQCSETWWSFLTFALVKW